MAALRAQSTLCGWRKKRVSGGRLGIRGKKLVQVSVTN